MSRGCQCLFVFDKCVRCKRTRWGCLGRCGSGGDNVRGWRPGGEEWGSGSSSGGHINNYPRHGSRDGKTQRALGVDEVMSAGRRKRKEETRVNRGQVAPPDATHPLQTNLLPPLQARFPPLPDPLSTLWEVGRKSTTSINLLAPSSHRLVPPSFPHPGFHTHAHRICVWLLDFSVGLQSSFTSTAKPDLKSNFPYHPQDISVSKTILIMDVKIFKF